MKYLIIGAYDFGESLSVIGESYYLDDAHEILESARSKGMLAWIVTTVG